MNLCASRTVMRWSFCFWTPILKAKNTIVASHTLWISGNKVRNTCVRPWKQSVRRMEQIPRTRGGPTSKLAKSSRMRTTLSIERLSRPCGCTTEMFRPMADNPISIRLPFQKCSSSIARADFGCDPLPQFAALCRLRPLDSAKLSQTGMAGAMVAGAARISTRSLLLISPTGRQCRA